MSLLSARSPGDVDIDRSVQQWNFACQSLCIAGMVLFFGLRLYTRVFILSGLGKEDWACLVATVLGVTYSVIALIMGHYGGGLHWSDVAEEDKIPFQKVSKTPTLRWTSLLTSQTIYATMVMYGPTAYLTKVCLLWIMTRVFSPFRKCVIFIRIFMGLMLAYYIPAVIVKVRICSPIATFWNKEIGGSCLDENAIIMADAVVSVVSDLIILILPLPLTLTLQMSTKRKMRVMGILGAGGLAVAASIIRLALIVVTGQSKDLSLAFMRINMLGNAEVAIGVICTCLPALSALIIRIYTEYSSNKVTSNYKMSTMRDQTAIERSRQQMSVRQTQTDSDEDVLMYNAQGNPKIETIIHGDSVGREESPRMMFGGIGVTRTVDVSTSVETR
ncbi:hypothetical protein N7541_010311 [Penicillium brevicompactum]|uniref:Rhodopsin domain-containing protein n=1 Tax=Penicillium brevicompactum TaxID=5074 RepID=A0A9W9QN68_PENBR|nr:hypothetical protein N7541_010311 [Penicillium brevicompactum]